MLYIINHGDMMRTYYVFKINKYFSYVYKNKSYKLYKMIEEICHANKYDIVLTYKMYEQVAVSFNKNNLNEYITNVYSECGKYIKNKNAHIYSDGYEYSKLVINNSHIKIKSNINVPIFFKAITNYSENIFICDFVNKDYFWLEEIFKNDRQNKEMIVK